MPLNPNYDGGDFSLHPEYPEYGFYAEKFSAHGRYEIARLAQAMEADWYDKRVVQKTTNPDELEDFRAYLKAYREKVMEYQILIDTRKRILTELLNHPTGIPREKLAKLVPHSGVTKFGVICNQMARGGWLRQEGDKKFVVYPVSVNPKPNSIFIEELFKHLGIFSKMQESSANTQSATNPTPRQGSGCMGALVIFPSALFLIWHLL